MRRLALIGLALATFEACRPSTPVAPRAPTHRLGIVVPSQQVTWGSAPVLLLDAGVDGGFFDGGYQDAGAGSTVCGFDGGFESAGDGGWIDGGEFDGGVCADGGTSCNSCGGSCAAWADGGFASLGDGGHNILCVDGGPQTIGPIYFWNGDVGSLTPASDPIDVGNSLHNAISCPLLCSAPTSAQVSAVLRGANADLAWSWIPSSSTSAVCVDGGLGDAGLFWDVESSFEFLDILILSNGPGDGGALPCTHFPKLTEPSL